MTTPAATPPMIRSRIEAFSRKRSSGAFGLILHKAEYIEVLDCAVGEKAVHREPEA